MSHTLLQARASGLADRILVHHGDIRDFVRPEPATVLLADLRGVLPFNGDALNSLDWARRHLLVEGGVMVPLRDEIYVLVCARVFLAAVV